MWTYFAPAYGRNGLTFGFHRSKNVLIKWLVALDDRTLDQLFKLMGLSTGP